MEDYYEVLDFWFDELTPDDWFKKDTQLDNKIRDRFLDEYYLITRGGYSEWRNSPKGILAMIIVLDQFARNMFRDTPKMFTFDMMAVNLTKHALENGYDKELEPKERVFLYMPLMHSEDLENQYLCVMLFEKLAKEDKTFEENLKFAKEHRDIISKFARFPHRNEILDRHTTPKEREFLETHKGF